MHGSTIVKVHTIIPRKELHFLQLLKEGFVTRRKKDYKNSNTGELNA